MAEFARTGALEASMGERGLITGLRANGELFAAENTDTKPGTSGDWVLVVPKPRDGRDATLPEPRTVRTSR